MFVTSKLLSAITQPLYWLAMWWGIALLLLEFNVRLRRTASGMLWLGLAVLVALCLRAIPDALLRPLENRYPLPTPQEVARYAGILVLGGATGDPDLFLANGNPPLLQGPQK